jgi:hypothetical protein
MSTFLLLHIDYYKELQTVTHYAYKYVGKLHFTTSQEKQRYVEFHTPVGQPTLIHYKKINTLLVDSVHTVSTEATTVSLYCATNDPHPKLGDYVFVH